MGEYSSARRRPSMGLMAVLAVMQGIGLAAASMEAPPMVNQAPSAPVGLEKMRKAQQKRDRRAAKRR